MKSSLLNLVQIMKKPYLIGAVVILLLFVSLSANSYRLSKQNKVLGAQFEALKKDPQMFAKEEIKALTDQLAKLVVLPEGEEPVVATVTDKERLKDQAVFAKAENGDKIVIYAKTQKAYIYRPSKNVLVDVIPVNIGNQQTAITGVDAKNPLKLALVNGSKNVGIASELEKRIMEKKIPGVEVVVKATAKSDSYAKTLVIDISGKMSKQAAEVAALVGGEVATESGEINPKADMMVIIGADFK